MCGIAGWVGLPAQKGVLQAMTDAIVHRGPDGEGHIQLPLEGDAVAAFGHRRLSIIDLDSGAQPMQSHDGRFTVVFNGEIYNYLELQDQLRAKGAIFRTHSDTEVILEAWRYWGADSLRRFRGMFAFAIHDELSRSVTLARDPFGKKPLLFAPIAIPGGEGLIFGSEVSAMLKHPALHPEIDVDSLYEYLCWRYVPGPNTFFKGIHKLKPGGIIKWQSRDWIEERYWLPPEEAGVERSSVASDPTVEFLEIFDEAVRLRLRADVPVGAFLSSGLDSSSVVATLAHLGAPEIRTFSVGFRGDAEAELPAAAETAKLLGTIHTPIELETDQMVSLLPSLSRRRGAPMSETADMPIYMMSLEAAKHVKVILSGEGADEMFGGYPKHVAEAYLASFSSLGLLPLASRAFLAIAPFVPMDTRRLVIAAEAMKERRFEERMPRWFGGLSREERAAIWTGPGSGRALNPIPFNAAKDASSLRQVLHFDQTSWLPDNLLERMDSMTMAASIEGRAPFMDVKLAEFAATLPDDQRIKGHTTKRILRAALHSRLPEAVIKRPKNGFRLPVSTWFRGELHDQFRSLVTSPNAITRDYIDQSAVLKISQEHYAGKSDQAKTLWALYALETFLREFFT